MNFKFRYICLLSVFLPFMATAMTEGKSFLRPVEQRDSVLIADQMEYGVVLDTLKDGSYFLFPELQCEGIDFLGGWKIDTLVTDGEKMPEGRFSVRGSILLTSFEEGTYRLPDIPVVLRNGREEKPDTLVFEGREVEFKTIPVDTATFTVHALKEPLDFPPAPKRGGFEVIWDFIKDHYIAISVILLVILCAVLYLLFHKKTEREERKVKDPAHIIALRSLDKFRVADHLTVEKQKWFYSGITDVLRAYIVEEFGISALEMTTNELFSELKKTDVPYELQGELKELFERADFVKFAKHTAAEHENAAALPLAVRFVTETYQRELEKESADDSEKKK